MLCHQFLIGGADTFSCLQTAFGKFIGRMQSAHNFCHNLYFIIFDNIFKIMCQDIHDRITRKFSQVQHILYFQFLSYFLVDTYLVFFDNFIYT